MLAVFAEFERSIIQERVRAGVQRAKREGKRLWRVGMSVRKTAAKFEVNPSTVQCVARTRCAEPRPAWRTHGGETDRLRIETRIARTGRTMARHAAGPWPRGDAQVLE